MSQPKVPLSELATAVQSAVEQVLGKNNAVPIDKLWIGFVAPDTVATEEAASKLAAQIGGANAQPSVAHITAPGGAHATERAAFPDIGRIIIGLIFQDK
jgi:hypothetical protein